MADLINHEKLTESLNRGVEVVTLIDQMMRLDIFEPMDKAMILTCKADIEYTNQLVRDILLGEYTEEQLGEVLLKMLTISKEAHDKFNKVCNKYGMK